MKKNKTRGLLRSVSYMSASIGLFLFGLALLIYLLIRSIMTAGALGKAESSLGVIALIAGIAGYVIALYGHFIVRVESKGDWRIGAALNGVLTLLLIFLYFLGIS